MGESRSMESCSCLWGLEEGFGASVTSPSSGASSLACFLGLGDRFSVLLCRLVCRQGQEGLQIPRTTHKRIVLGSEEGQNHLSTIA